ncbi:MAG: Holliday junction branch migration protein RuvA [Victivallaceae bacterium]|nr:Holliday junction branch migration protein RuvA [Victivallaceae bacterium]
MIGWLSGILREADTNGCIVDCNGVGYVVEVPLSTLDKLPLPGGHVELHVFTQVREDAITLYGFATPAEKKLFLLLLTVSGVGGKLALNTLGAMGIDEFCSAIVSGDVKTLSRINGIGKRTAERIIVDLKDKIADGFAIDTSAAPAAGRAAMDAALALEQLGFKRDAANRAINALLAELPPEEQTTENLVRLALRNNTK